MLMPSKDAARDSDLPLVQAGLINVRTICAHIMRPDLLQGQFASVLHSVDEANAIDDHYVTILNGYINAQQRYDESNPLRCEEN